MNKQKKVLIPKSDFPDHLVSNAEKDSPAYGLKVAKAIQQEWFSGEKPESNSCLFYNQFDVFEERRRYASGTQSTQKFRKQLSRNGNKSYINIDWRPPQIGSKFVDMVVNGINEREFAVRCFSQDATTADLRDSYQKVIEKDMVAKPLLQMAKEKFGIDAFNVDNPDEMPQTAEELQLHMQMKFKPSIEIANEIAINTVFDMNDFPELKGDNVQDLVEIGKAIGKTRYVDGEGIKIDYVDPQFTIHSDSDDKYYRDLFYVGEVKQVPVTEIKKENPTISDTEFKVIQESSSDWNQWFTSSVKHKNGLFRKGYANLMYFSYKTTRKSVYKIKNTKGGGKRAIPKDETFNPEENDLFRKAEMEYDVWYTGVYVLGTDIILNWKLEENMVRPSSSFKKCIPPYFVVAPRKESGRNGMPMSIVSRMMVYIDQMCLNHFKLQQIAQKVIPDGVFLDADGFVGVNLGNGSKYDPNTALDLFFETGSVVGRSYTMDGDYNNAKIPIKELNHSSGLNKMQAFITNMNYQLSMMKEVIGMNSGSDASTPDPKALVGVQKLAALNSNVATRHVRNASLWLTKQYAVATSYRIADILKDPDTAFEFANQIGQYNVSVLDSIKQLPNHSFGIFIEVEPDAEEKEAFDRDINEALKAGLIELDDAMEIRVIKNIKIAMELLKVRKKRNAEKKQQQEMQKIEAQTASNIRSAQEAAKAKMAEIAAKNQATLQEIQAKAQAEMAVIEKQGEVKSILMDKEYQYNIELQTAVQQTATQQKHELEDRKDKRQDKQAQNESELIEQRQRSLPPKRFESTNDHLSDIDILA